MREFPEEQPPLGFPPFKSVYPATASAVDWMTHRLEVVDQSTFIHFVETYRLKEMVDRAERTGSRVRRFQARTAIDEYREDTGRNVMYSDLRDRVSGFLPAFEGEWVIFTDRMHDLLHMQDFSDGTLEDFLYLAPLQVKVVILWLVGGDSFVVYRSTHIDDRRVQDPECSLSDGMTWGGENDVPSFVLNPELEATLRQDLYESVSSPTEDLMTRNIPSFEVDYDDAGLPVARHIEPVSIFDLIHGLGPSQ